MLGKNIGAKTIDAVVPKRKRSYHSIAVPYAEPITALRARSGEISKASGATWTTPEGGFYVWVTVPESLDAADLVFEAIDQGVIYIPGNAFYGDGRGRHEMRMSFSLPSVDDISRGVEIIGRVLSQ